MTDPVQKNDCYYWLRI